MQISDSISRRDRLPLQTLAESYLPGRAGAHSHAPDMTAIDIVLIRREDRFLAVFGKRNVLDFKRAGRQPGRRSARRGNGIQVFPPIFLPRKYDAVSSAPAQLILGNGGVKHAARSRVGAPDLPPRAVRDIGDANGPRLGRTARVAASSAGLQNTEEHELLSIGRPRRIAVMVHARVHIGHGFRTEIVNRQKTVVAAVAYKRQLHPVRRPREFFGRSTRPRMNQLRWLSRAVQWRGPDLSSAQKSQAPAPRSRCR